MALSFQSCGVASNKRSATFNDGTNNDSTADGASSPSSLQNQFTADEGTFAETKQIESASRNFQMEKQILYPGDEVKLPVVRKQQSAGENPFLLMTFRCYDGDKTFRQADKRGMTLLGHSEVIVQTQRASLQTESGKAKYVAVLCAASREKLLDGRLNKNILGNTAASLQIEEGKEISVRDQTVQSEVFGVNERIGDQPVSFFCTGDLEGGMMKFQNNELTLLMSQGSGMIVAQKNVSDNTLARKVMSCIL